MHVQFFTAQVCDGVIVPDDDVDLEEGSRVMVLANGPESSGELTESEEKEWLESLPSPIPWPGNGRSDS